ncbi:hypothetical protein BCV72DRAFT_304826 [Rhizopus microsporus var. microsporus]|uniref:RRM domain-containing protein n=2 Tax=Rhizopus microsporus TaxID=58291 RepID=A0A2G4SMK5_RHIZD|nr:uncharacterized protein RHIMIDRAFT_240086 [Rhizopus microsporus ATCC 52813]ORE07200.1 hypothetical protein BCV72DRAFT_304826 [Rhizopus microsporus var. microsporus]PHZ09972.1 hypothetical protein RHIMIDRAFT_240086 [Rhizopus microsporus ATCC 52813]
MKRSQDTQEANDTKKPRLNQANYNNNDPYAQYSLLSQYGTAFAQNGVTVGGYGQPASMYGLGYGNASMVAPYGYPPAFFNPAAAAAAYSGVLGEGNRTIYLGGVPPNTPPGDILKQIKSGAIEQYKALPEKACVFITFVDASAAHMFYQELMLKKLAVNGQELKYGWGNSTSMSLSLKLQIQSGATRSVYIGRYDEQQVSKEQLASEVTKFGQIEDIKVVPDKHCVFIHFLSISSAIKCVSELPNQPSFHNKRINYAKDHCASNYPADVLASNPSPSFGFDAYGNPVMNSINLNTAPTANNILRTLYIGNIQSEAKVEDICNSIRGGNVLQVRYFPEKHIAFVSFMDAATAIAVFNYANSQGIVIKGRKVKVGWGKPSAIPTQLMHAIQQGATRNVYIGGIEDVSEEKLRQDFESFGEIELVNIFNEKRCAFVNFTSVQSAVMAVTTVKQKNPFYQSLKVNYGKDRCANPPKIRSNKGDAEPKLGMAAEPAKQPEQQQVQ